MNAIEKVYIVWETMPKNSLRFLVTILEIGALVALACMLIIITSSIKTPPHEELIMAGADFSTSLILLALGDPISEISLPGKISSQQVTTEIIQVLDFWVLCGLLSLSGCSLVKFMLTSIKERSREIDIHVGCAYHTHICIRYNRFSMDKSFFI